ncbi:M23 family peptidase [Clostridium sp. AF19-22AC]|uniref:Peptidase M23-like protein n=1 Tax=Faecalicatena orotica TaxID=1544 RepID=A0A2Y9CAN2_9FIRM|nr:MULTISPECIES: M23 family metallopeptidase [Clostridia]PWJ22918.1 peptidase M23-like protein [Faecalicatena orotica]RHR20784.1 M23 family peptidase [Clostridium sp. AF19-22AC]SSA58054.1 Peptidase family M23 [Faecalicatena orotica]
MNKNEKPFSLKGKGAAVGIVICFVAVIVMVGAFTFNNYQKKLDEQLAKAEEQTEQLAKEKSEATTANDIVLPEAEGNTSTENETEDNESTTPESTADNSATASGASDVWFSEESVLEWPASGAILINYSMDKTVYFSTLEQYKYNPALVIGGEVGETIAASAAGIVTNVEQSAQTGTTVTLDMGNGYTAVYGQLKEVPLQIGDYVAAGETVGYLSEPTKYYSVEGTNLYFEILKDGEPVNPLDFMES